jgi:hypothetical protein
MKRSIFNRIMRDTGAGSEGGGDAGGSEGDATELEKLKGVHTTLNADLGKKTGTINLLKEHFGLNDIPADQLEAKLGELKTAKDLADKEANDERIKGLSELERITEERDGLKTDRDTFKTENETLKNSKIKADFTDLLRPALSKANAIDNKMGTIVKSFLLENPDFASISADDLDAKVETWLNLPDNLGFKKAPADGGGGGGGGGEVVAGETVLQDLQKQFQ